MALYTATPPVATDSHGSAAESVPADLDPGTHPIISRHYFGVEPPRSIGPIAAEVVADLRFRRQVEHLHALGVRATAEFMAEIGSERGIRALIDRKLETYAELDSKVIEAFEGAGFWPAPIQEIER